MKIVRFACVEGVTCLARDWVYGCNVGRCLLDVEVRGVARVARVASLKDLVEVLEAVASRAHRFAVVEDAVGRVSALLRHRTAGLADIFESTG